MPSRLIVQSPPWLLFLFLWSLPSLREVVVLHAVDVTVHCRGTSQSTTAVHGTTQLSSVSALGIISRQESRASHPDSLAPADWWGRHFRAWS